MRTVDDATAVQHVRRDQTTEEQALRAQEEPHGQLVIRETRR